ncbi:MAG TPA: hypothetical protein VGB59_03265 [Allosphingosinicella sp.]|jgi:hypothetical protein
MSHIPNSAMPHAAPSQNEEKEQGSSATSTISETAGKIAELARENPKAAIAAGAALAGVVAAAAIPLVRGRSKSESGSSGSKSSSSGSKSGTGSRSKSSGSKSTSKK